MKWTRSWLRGWKGKVSGSTHLSLTAPVAGTFLEALCRVLCQCSSLGRRKVSGSAHLSLTAPVPARLWKRVALCFAIALPWVRARGAHCKTVCTRSTCKTFAVPLARGLRGPSPMDSLCFVRRHTLPEDSSPLGSIRFAFGLCARSFAVRAPCAHQRQGSASHKAKRFQKRAGHRAGTEKGLRESLNLSLPKAKPSLVKGTRGALPFHKPLGVKRSIEKLAFHKPMSCRRQRKGKWLSLSFRPPRLCLPVIGSALPSALPMLRLGCAHEARTAKRFARGP